MNNFDKKVKLSMLFASIIFGIGFSVYFLQIEGTLETYSGQPRAVIIDQLYDEMPNVDFHIKATEYLQNAGYDVDIITTQDVTVDYWKKLPTLNYKYVIVRTHGAENIDDVVLFTGERYSEDKYISEQLFGQVKKATPLRELTYIINNQNSTEWVVVNETDKYLKTTITPVDETRDEFFAIGTELVKQGMKGTFDGTVFVLGGCNTLSNPSLAKSLTERGASLVVGWDNTVGNADNDYAILQFLNNLFVENKGMADVLDELPTYVSQKRMVYPANFTYYS